MDVKHFLQGLPAIKNVDLKKMLFKDFLGKNRGFLKHFNYFQALLVKNRFKKSFKKYFQGLFYTKKMKF